MLKSNVVISYFWQKPHVMKKTLLSIALLLSVASFGQTVNNFYPFNPDLSPYTLATSSPELDQSAMGENVIWNFNNLAGYGNSVTTVEEATSEQQATFPGSTLTVSTTSETEIVSEFYLANDISGSVSVIGASSNGLTLNYITNNFNLGNFPKSYGNTAISDEVAGTFDGNGVNGTFSGIGTVSVDGYGVINTNIGISGQPQTLTVTRLKIEQNLNLYFSGVPVGTLTQVMYSYYSISPQDEPIFRTLTATVNIPAFGINETQQSIEVYADPSMGIDYTASLTKVAIAPNPVNDVLHIGGSNDITAITVVDTAGRMVLQSTGNDVSVSHLSSGIYYVSATAGNAVKTLKMVKQ